MIRKAKLLLFVCKILLIPIMLSILFCQLVDNILRIEMYSVRCTLTVRQAVVLCQLYSVLCQLYSVSCTRTVRQAVVLCSLYSVLYKAVNSAILTTTWLAFSKLGMGRNS